MNNPQKQNIQRPAFTLTESLVIGAFFGVVILAATLLLSTERARTRDMKRLADMTRLSGGFALLYSQKASYVDAAVGCAAIGVEATTCSLSDVVTGLSAMKDPSKFHYTVIKVPDIEDFGISFHLERSYGALRAGTHVLSKAGIQ